MNRDGQPPPPPERETKPGIGPRVQRYEVTSIPAANCQCPGKPVTFLYDDVIYCHLCRRPV